MPQRPYSHVAPGSEDDDDDYVARINSQLRSQPALSLEAYEGEIDPDPQHDEMRDRAAAPRAGSLAFIGRNRP